MNNDTDKARACLKGVMGHCYHTYIDEKLAGDFAYHLAKQVEKDKKRKKALSYLMKKASGKLTSSEWGYLERLLK